MSHKNVTSAEFSGFAKARSKTYGFLSLIYLQSPNEEFLQKIFDPNFLSFLTSLKAKKGFPKEMTEGLKIIEDFIDESKKTSIKELHKKLSVDYTRLFRGVKRFYGPPPPYESVYREGPLMGESTVEVSKEYREAGVRLPNHLKGEPPDYIGFELDFMRFLCNKEAEAWKNHNEKEALKFLDKERRFLNEHLAKWVPSFCDKIISDSNVDFYRGLAKITKAFILLDQSQIDSILASIKDVAN